MPQHSTRVNYALPLPTLQALHYCTKNTQMPYCRSTVVIWQHCSSPVLALGASVAVLGTVKALLQHSMIRTLRWPAANAPQYCSRDAPMPQYRSTAVTNESCIS
eukprot:9329313-Pyramimonas_sp.AAC.1